MKCRPAIDVKMEFFVTNQENEQWIWYRIARARRHTSMSHGKQLALSVARATLGQAERLSNLGAP